MIVFATGWPSAYCLSNTESEDMSPCLTTLVDLEGSTTCVASMLGVMFESKDIVELGLGWGWVQDWSTKGQNCLA